MFNLLPLSEKIKIRHEYIMRFLVVAFFFLFITVCIGMILLFPSYLISKSKEKAARQTNEALEKSLQARDDSGFQALLKQTGDKIKVLTESPKAVGITDIFDHILDKKSSLIKLTNISFSDDGNNAEIILKGMASDRDSLLAFTKQIEKDSLFSKVDLPISNFTKDKNIDFSLKINLAQK